MLAGFADETGRLPAPRPTAQNSPLFAGGIWQRLRIFSGLVLFVFAFFHLLNHALGIWGVGPMEAFQAWRVPIQRSLPVSALLAAAFFTHLFLNLWRIATRSTWRMPLWEGLQIALGLSIPVLLMQHAPYLRAAASIEGVSTTYSRVLPALWSEHTWNQTLLVLVVWSHGCIGLHFWLRLGNFYRRIAPLLLAIAVLLPALSLAGFVAAGRESLAGPVLASEAVQPTGITARDIERSAVDTAWALRALLAIALAIRVVLHLSRRRIRVRYTDGPTLLAPAGPTLLELSRAYRVPHASVCGGRARCSTCRVRIESTEAALSPITSAEGATLRRIHAEPDVRLACQLRPRGDMTVTRLVRPPDEARPGFATATEAAGVERTLAVLFLDIRGFTTLSEARLPYDTVFLLNRFFTEVGEALIASGGWIDKYLGDGLMALFGLNQPTDAACRAALAAAVGIDAALERLNLELGEELAGPLKIGIGLHVGPLVLGRIGHTASAATTVIGPVVNVASRLEALTKEHDVQVVASSALARRASLDLGAFPTTSVTVRGTSEELAVLLIPRGRDLAPFLENTAVPAAA
jgi:adenylate cyclase